MSIEQFLLDYPSLPEYLKVNACFQTWKEGIIPPDKNRNFRAESPALGRFFDALNYDFLSKKPRWAGQYGTYGHNNIKEYTQADFERMRDNNLEQARRIIQNSRKFDSPDAYTHWSNWII